MQCLGLFVILFIFISPIRGQHTGFLFVCFWLLTSPSLPAFQPSLWRGSGICWITGFAFPFRSPHSHLEAWNCWWLLHSCLLIWWGWGEDIPFHKDGKVWLLHFPKNLGPWHSSEWQTYSVLANSNFTKCTPCFFFQ